MYGRLISRVTEICMVIREKERKKEEESSRYLP